LSSHNPAFGAVFNCKFKDIFDRKPNEIPAMGIRIQPGLHTVGFAKFNAIQYLYPAALPWLLNQPEINFTLPQYFKQDTSPEIYRKKFF